MAFFALGLNHTTAPIELRELAAFNSSRIEEALADLSSLASDLSECVILSTCNRTELYLVMHASLEKKVRRWWVEYNKIRFHHFDSHVYCYRDFQAIRHIARVACGLDSMVLGETQIMGQLKDAIQKSRSTNIFGPQLENIFNNILSTAKKVRSYTAIGKHSVSVAGTATALAERIFSNLSEKKILLIGAGATIKLVAEHFIAQGVTSFAVVNRSFENAKLLASEINGQALEFHNLIKTLNEFDVIVAATASVIPIIGKGSVELAMKSRRYKPMLMIDLSIPRDIESETGKIEGVFLYSIDDLDLLVDENLAERKNAANEAEKIIDDALLSFKRQIRTVEIGSIIGSLHSKTKRIAHLEVDRVLMQIEKGGCPEQAVRKLAHQLTKKILHGPTIRLRAAAEDEDFAVLEAAKKLFEIDEPEK